MFDRLTSRLIATIQDDPSKASSAVTERGTDQDWALAALNSPAGHIAGAVFNILWKSLNSEPRPPATWLTHAENLLQLRGDPHRHAVTIFSRHLDWFYRTVPEWTANHLLSRLEGGNKRDQAAIWAGVFWHPIVTSPELYLRLEPPLLALAKQKDLIREGNIQSLASLVLRGWRWKHPNRLVSNNEMNDVLLSGGDDVRSHIVWHFQRAFHENVEGEIDDWISDAIELFDRAWPRQRSVKNQRMAFRLVELVTENARAFASLAEVILPLLTKISAPHGLYFQDEAADEIIKKHPRLLLKILVAILADDVSKWPYGVGEVLERMATSDDNLSSDPHFRELKLKWDSR
ncbi:MAG: hypothetical protein WEB58_16895 [Planctomycetaceae bacterium]